MGYGARGNATFPKKKRNKARIRIAYDKERKRIIDFEIGDRSRKTFRRSRKKLKKHDVEVYFSDDREASNEFYPKKNILHTNLELVA